jgi:hypothetical protein
VEKLLRERDAKVEELDKFIKVTPGQLWDRDLDTFLESWRVSTFPSLHPPRILRWLVLGRSDCSTMTPNSSARLGALPRERSKRRFALASLSVMVQRAKIRLYPMKTTTTHVRRQRLRKLLASARRNRLRLA